MEINTLILAFGCFFAGFIDSIAGGGGLISIPLLLHLGLSPKIAIGSNKLIGFAAASTSTLSYWRAGHIQWSKLGHAAVGGLCGGLLGAYAVSLVDNSLLKPFIIMGLVGASILSLRRSYFSDTPSHKIQGKHIYFMVGFFLGIYDGFFGPGTGSFLMIIFISYMGMSSLQASASARLVNLATNFAALVLFISKGLVDFRYALIGMTCAALGAMVGSKLSILKGTRLIRPLYFLVVWSMILKLLYDWLSP